MESPYPIVEYTSSIAGVSLDEKLATVLLMYTAGDLNKACETHYSMSTEEYWVCNIVRDAISQLDISLIRLIVQRLDGGTPLKESFNEYSNKFGTILQEIMTLPINEIAVLRMADPVYALLAKAVIHISLQNPGTNPQKKRDKAIATELIFERTGGRVPEPVKELIDKKYINPDWMRQLPSSDDGGVSVDDDDIADE